MAIAQYQRALEIKPQFVGARVNLAITYSRVGDDAGAERILKDALRAETTQKGVIYYNLGDLLEKQGRRGEAIQYYRSAFGHEFPPGVIYRRLGTLYLAAEQYEEAREAFEMALANQEDPTSPYKNMLRSSLAIFEDDTINLPIIKEQLARDIRAEDLTPYDLEIIHQMQQKSPEIAKTHDLLGLAYVRLGDADRAIEHFEKSLQILPGNRDVTKNLQLAREFKKTGQVPTSPQ
jgi:tetratricopeptide (TPR) repeat protein